MAFLFKNNVLNAPIRALTWPFKDGTEYASSALVLVLELIFEDVEFKPTSRLEEKGSWKLKIFS